MMTGTLPKHKSALVLLWVVGLVINLVAPSVLGQQSAGENSNTDATPSPTATVIPSPTPIPISAVVTQSDEVVKKLGQIKKELTDSSPVVQIRADLAEFKNEVDTQKTRIDNTLPFEARIRCSFYPGRGLQMLPTRNDVLRH